MSELSHRIASRTAGQEPDEVEYIIEQELAPLLEMQETVAELVEGLKRLLSLVELGD